MNLHCDRYSQKTREIFEELSSFSNLRNCSEDDLEKESNFFANRLGTLSLLFRFGFLGWFTPNGLFVG